MLTLIVWGILHFVTYTHTSYLQIATKVTAQETLQLVASTYTDTQSRLQSLQSLQPDDFPTWNNVTLDPVPLFLGQTVTGRGGGGGWEGYSGGNHKQTHMHTPWRGH